MCWADKLGVVVTLLLVVISVMIVVPGDQWKVPVYFGVPIWLLARAVDWIADGPRRRSGHFTIRSEK
jgi:hypothetical protein